MNAVATERLDALAPIWKALRPGSDPTLLCTYHLVTEPELCDVVPTSGRCSLCTEPAVVSQHASARWIERVDPKATPAMAGA